jgi:transketolase C-terminal domain/subunit
LLGLGELINECLAARVSLEEMGLSVGVVHIPVIKPMDLTWLESISPDALVVIVEEHVLEGGFGSAILEGMAEAGWKGNVIRRGVTSKVLSAVGSQEYLRALCAIDRDSIVALVLDQLKPRILGST